MGSIVYKKHPLAEFLEELPGYINQFQMAQLQKEKEDTLMDKRFEQEMALLNLRLDAQNASDDKRHYTGVYQDLVEKADAAEATYRKYATLSPEDIAGARELTANFIEKGKVNEEKALNKIMELSSYINKLNMGHDSIDEEVVKFNNMAPSYHGINTVLQPFEFQEYKADALSDPELSEDERTLRGGAMDYAYGLKGTEDDIQKRNLVMTDYYTKDLKQGAANSYAVIQGSFALNEGEDIDDLRARFAVEGKTPPSDKVITMAGELVLQPDYNDFMAQTDPTWEQG